MHVLAHISDVHFLAGGRALHGSVDVEGNLRLALDRLERSGVSPEALVFTGDLADLGEPDAYARLRAIVEPFAARMSAAVVWVMGNHDERPGYATGLFDEPPSQRPQDRVHDVNGLRVISLDTSVPGYHHGDLTEAQLDWLRAELAVPAAHGTLLAMHHPPIPVAVDIMAVLELLDQPRLARVVEGSDVRGILAGHLHYATHSTFAGVPVSVAAATCYSLDLLPEQRLLSGIDAGQSINLVHVYADRVVHSVAPIRAGAEITGAPERVRSRLEHLDPQERHELLSNKRSDLSFDDDDA